LLHLWEYKQIELAYERIVDYSGFVDEHIVDYSGFVDVFQWNLWFPVVNAEIV
jgi:hypothetical protein